MSASSIQQNKNRIYLWDNLKIILILFVVIHHASAPYGLIKGQQWYRMLYMIIMPYTMPTFTIISGYWFKPRSINVLAKKFLLPALLIVFLCYGLWLHSPVEYINHFCPWTLDIMWYLWALFFYYLITPKLQKYNLNILLIASVLLSLIAGFISWIGVPFALSRIIGFYPFFLLGLRIRSSEKWHTLSQSRKTVSVARIVFVITLLLSFALFLYDKSFLTYTTFFRDYSGGNLNPAICRLFAYFVCTILSLSLILSMPNKEYWFTKYGVRSLTPYILHPLLLYAFSWNLALPIMDKWYGYVFYMFVIPLLSMMTVHSKIHGFVKKLTS